MGGFRCGSLIAVTVTAVIARPRPGGCRSRPALAVQEPLYEQARLLLTRLRLLTPGVGRWVGR